MKSDVEIASQASLRPIGEVAKELGLPEESISFYGRWMAKIEPKATRDLEQKGKLILMTAMNPTPLGEGKTTMSIALSMGLHRLGHKTVCALREPSLGPVFGIKGGAAGGGYSQVLPMEDINLHFTGDFHAITSAHNLISAALDNHLHQGNALGIDPRTITWKRVLDMNDRALRSIVIGLGPRANGVVREDGFDITVASEIMAILCLSKDLMDLKERIGRIRLASTYDNHMVTVKDLGVDGAATLLLKDAIKPNLVQTIENTPAIVHGGPFANIAHGCNSITGTLAALSLGDLVVTEAGFGADLGAEKFLDIKCRTHGIAPDAIVLVATIRALKYHGDVSKENLLEENIDAMLQGTENLLRHYENLTSYGRPVVVCINAFPADTRGEKEALQELLEGKRIPFAHCEGFAKGGEGAEELAKAVLSVLEEEKDTPLTHPYRLEDSIEEKIRALATKLYGARDVDFSKEARKSIAEIEELGEGNLPICVAKTQYSFSDDPDLLGAPSGYTLHVREVVLQRGAGFIVVKTGQILTMPGLPKVPAANNMDIDAEGQIVGLF